MIDKLNRSLLAAALILAQPFAAAGQNVVRIPGPGGRSPAPAVCSGSGIQVCDMGELLQSSGHTCTISSVSLATGDSITVASVTPPLGGTTTATWNGNGLTEIASGATDGSVEIHVFTASNVTGGTGSVVLTKSSSGDDTLVFDCAAARVTGLTTKALDGGSVNNSPASTTWGTNTVSTSAANDGIVAFLGVAASAVSPGPWGLSFTRLNQESQASGSCCFVDYGYLVTTAQSPPAYDGQTTGNPNLTHVSGIVAFK